MAIEDLSHKQLEMYAQRAISKSKLVNRCWISGHSTTLDGYAQIGTTPAPRVSEVRRVHRLVYMYYNGAIPDGLQIDHTCFVRNCINPQHLEAVTPSENTRRANKKSLKGLFCKHGHEINEENVYISPNGRRHCLACEHVRRRARRAREGRTYRQSKLICPQGHWLLGDNVYVNFSSTGKTVRACKTCRLDRRHKGAA